MCHLYDQDVAFHITISHSKTPEHRVGISSILLSRGVESLLRESPFVTTTHVKYWFICTSPNEAQKNDLEFLKAIHTYQDKEVSQVALTAFSLWYLSETLVCLSLFDDSVTVDEKQRMVCSMRNNQGSDEPPKSLPPIHNPTTKALPDFFTTSTNNISQILELDDSFLDRDPQQCES